MKTKPLKRIILNKKYIHELNDILSDASHHICAIFASACANHVMEKYIEDHEINYLAKHAILVSERWITNDITIKEARDYALKIHAVARMEENLDLKYFYRACGHAAATPHVKKHALHAANYALKSLLSSKSKDMHDLEENERAWQIKHLLSLK